MSDLGALLKQGRKHAGLTQREVAAHFGIDFTYVSKIETGASEFSPSDKLIQGFADLYGLDGDGLFVAAGKCPPDLRDRLCTDLAFVRRVRACTTGDGSAEETTA